MSTIFSHPLFWPLINVGILFSFLFIKVKDPVKAHVASRTDTIKETLEKTARDFEEAQSELKKIEVRLGIVEQEQKRILRDAIVAAEERNRRMITAAENAAVAIKRDAKDAADAAYLDARSELVKDLGIKVVQAAESLVSAALTPEERVRFRKNSVNQMGL